MTTQTAYALYRRSTAQQDLSIEEQRQAVRAWAAEHGYEIIQEFADDASGLDTARRREFLALLQLCAESGQRRADVVLCYDVSRFSRLDPEEAGFHEYSLRRAGVRVLYTHEPGVNEAGVTGHLVKALKRVLAHDYSQKLSQLVRRGKRAHAALGHWTGGRPPYGFRRAVRGIDGTLAPVAPGRWKAHGEAIVLVVEPAEAAIVREIFEAYSRGGLGLSAIAQRLNARGVPPPGSLRRVGRAAWAKSGVWAILRNPAYVGRQVYGKARYREVGKKRGKVRLPEAEHVIAESVVPAILTRELWEAAQAVHGTRRFATGRPYHRPYLLSGLIACGACEKRYQAQRRDRGRVRAYYVCGGIVASGAAFCASPRIPTSYLDDAVLDGLQKRLDRILVPAELRHRLTRALGRDAREEANALPALEARLRETERRITRVVDALADGHDELPSLRARLVTLEQERAALRQEHAALQTRRPRGEGWGDDVVESLIASLARVRDVLEAGEPEERKAVVRSFLKRIRIDGAHRRAVLEWYRLPRDVSVKLVAVGGIEPPTRGL